MTPPIDANPGNGIASLLGSFSQGDPQDVLALHGLLPDLATRLVGSSDLYGPRRRGPDASINLVTVHDGFTLTPKFHVLRALTRRTAFSVPAHG